MMKAYKSDPLSMTARNEFKPSRWGPGHSAERKKWRMAAVAASRPSGGGGGQWQAWPSLGGAFQHIKEASLATLVSCP